MLKIKILHLIALARKHDFGLPQAKQENKNHQIFDPQLMCPDVPDVVQIKQAEPEGFGIQ